MSGRAGTGDTHICRLGLATVASWRRGNDSEVAGVETGQHLRLKERRVG